MGETSGSATPLEILVVVPYSIVHTANQYFDSLKKLHNGDPPPVNAHIIEYETAAELIAKGALTGKCPYDGAIFGVHIDSDISQGTERDVMREAQNRRLPSLMVRTEHSGHFNVPETGIYNLKTGEGTHTPPFTPTGSVYTWDYITKALLKLLGRDTAILEPAYQTF